MPKVRIGSLKEPGDEKPQEQAPVAVQEGPPKLAPLASPREISVKWWPQIRQGTCEFCGIIDPKIPAWEQYQHCKHYKGLEMKCLYCPRGTDPKDIFKGRTLKIVEKTERPGVLYTFCDDLRCEGAFYSSFRA